MRIVGTAEEIRVFYELAKRGELDKVVDVEPVYIDADVCHSVKYLGRTLEMVEQAPPSPPSDCE